MKDALAKRLQRIKRRPLTLDELIEMHDDLAVLDALDDAPAEWRQALEL